MQNQIEQEALDIKKQAQLLAFEVLETAKETARQMILSTNLDVSRIPLICNKIIAIQEDIDEIKTIIKEEHSDHEIRLRATEKYQWKTIGALLIVPPIVTITIAYVISIIKNKL